MRKEINEIASYYGYDSQSHMLIEEMAELTQALNKYYRLTGKHGYPAEGEVGEVVANIYEEIADVEICLSELVYLLGCRDSVDAWKRYKVDRQMERMKRSDNRTQSLLENTKKWSDAIEKKGYIN